MLRLRSAQAAQPLNRVTAAGYKIIISKKKDCLLREWNFIFEL